MAGLTKAQRAERAAALEKANMTDAINLTPEEQAAADLAAQEVDNSHLITVSKDGEEIDVHPSCLADHKRIGWKEA